MFTHKLEIARGL